MRYALTALVLTVSLAAAPEKLQFVPEVGRPCQKTFQLTREIVLDELSRKMDGEELVSEAPMTARVRELRVQVTDEAIEVEDGELSRFRRRFDLLEQVTSHPGPTGESEESVYASPLKGVSVLLAKDAGDEDWSATFEEGEQADDKLLDGLLGEIELDELLSEEEVDRNDQWEIPPERFFPLLDHFGAMAFERVETVESGGSGWHTIPGEPVEQPEPEVDGEFSATFTRRKKQDGVAVAFVELEFDLQIRTDTTASRQHFNDLLGGNGWKVNSAEFTVAYRGDGLLTWDRKAGRAVSLTLEFEVIETDTSESARSSADGDHLFEELRVSHGSGKVEYLFE